jgi:hypothetical protein
MRTRAPHVPALDVALPSQSSATRKQSKRARRHSATWLQKTFRDVSKVGGQSGQAAAFRVDHSENTGRSRVRSQCQLAYKSSKCVQTGEPLLSSAIHCDLVLLSDTDCYRKPRLSGVYCEWKAIWPLRNPPMSSGRFRQITPPRRAPLGIQHKR